MAYAIVQTSPNFTIYNVMPMYREISSPVILDQTTFSFQNALRQLNRMRMKGFLCDAVLATADSGTFRVHKVILSSCSNYFRTLFTTSLKEKSSGEGSQHKMYFLIPNVSSTILEMIIQFAYSGIVNVNKRNVNRLLPAADQFNVNGVVDACINFMLKNITPNNCIGIWRFGKEYFIPQLEREALSYTLIHFLEVLISSVEFLHLKLKYLKEILENSSLNVPSEFFVWMAIKRWCQFKYRSRLQFIPELLLCVRMPLLPIPDFKQIMDDPRVYRHFQCRPYINMVSKYMLNEIRDLSNVIQDKRVVFMFTPRYPYELIFAIGGWSLSGPTTIFEVYDCRADLWKMMFMEDYLGPRVYHQIVSSGHYVYIIGGSTGTDCLSSCWRFDTRNMRFEEIPSMQEKRCFLSVAKLSDKIYAIGGYDGYDRSQTVEYFDDVKNQWIYVSSMLEKRSDASASSLRSRIFVVGGFNGSDFLQSAESYYSEFDQWFLIAPMIRCRSGVGCVASDNAVYAIGGYDGQQRLNSVEKYCVTSRQWFPTKPMRLARSNFAVALMENKIYVMGGYDDVNDTTTDQSEVFDPSKPQWRSIASLNVGRSGLSTCTHSGFANIKPYIKDDRFRCLLKSASKEDTIIDMGDID